MNQKPGHYAGSLLATAVLACAALAGRSLPAAVTIDDFEKGLDGWVETKEIKLSLVEGRAPGSRAMKVDYVGYHDNWKMARKIFRQDLGDVDALALWIKGVGPRPVTVELYLLGNNYKPHRHVALATPRWRRVVIPFRSFRAWGHKLPLNASTVMEIGLRCFGAKQTIVLDDVVLVKSPAKPPAREVSLAIDAARPEGKLPACSVPIICTEYGPGLKGRVLSSSFAAADLLRTIHAFQEVHTENDPYVRLWYHGLHQGGFGRGPDQYAFGLYMKQGKHLYPTAINFAYRLMSRWGDERLGLTGSGLGENVAAIASRSPKRVAVAVYHVDPAHPMQGGNPAKVRLAIRNLGPRRKASLYRIDHRHHDLYSFWNEQLGRPESDRGDRALSRELHEKLLAKEELTPLPLPAGAAIEDGTLRCTLEVAANGVAFVFVEE